MVKSADSGQIAKARRMRLKFDFGKLDTNHHDWSDGKKGVTIHGPKLTLVKLETLTASGVKRLTGRRLWFYFPDGACWNFDVYLRREIFRAHFSLSPVLQGGNTVSRRNFYDAERESTSK